MKRLYLLLMPFMLSTATYAQEQLIGWDVTGQGMEAGKGDPAWGNEGLLPTTKSDGLDVTGLTRLTKFSTQAANNNSVFNIWGGGYTTSTLPAGEDADSGFTFTVKPKDGKKLSLSSVDLYYRRASYGPAQGKLQYKINDGAYTDIQTLSFDPTTGGGFSLPQVSLSSVAELQDVKSDETITFRMLLFAKDPNGAGSTVNWFILNNPDVPTENSDFYFSGTVEDDAVAPPAGCLTVNPDRPKYPYVAMTPTCTGEPQILAAFGRTGEYTEVNVTEGTTYTFTSSVGTDFVTIANADGSQILAAGNSGLTWTADATQKIRYYLHLDNNCNWDATSTREKMLTCGSMPDVPENDDCANAIALSCGDVATGSTVSATDSGGNLSNDVFYKFTGNGTKQIITVSLCGSNFDTALKVYKDCSLSEAVAMNDDSFTCGTNAEVMFTSDGTSTYIILVEGYEGSGGNYRSGDYKISLVCNDPPMNDDCANAIPIACGETQTGTTLYADNSGGNNSKDVFYTYTGNGTPEKVTVSLCGSSYDTLVRVFSDCTLTNEIAMNDESASCGEQSQVSFTSDGTSTYVIMVEGYEGALGDTYAGDYTIAVTCGEVEIPCQPELYCGDGSVINNVTFEEINNDSQCSEKGYSNYSTMVANVKAGQTYPISVSVGDGWTHESVMVWIDFNDNGIFEPSEYYFVGSQPNTTNTANITIPEGTEDGQYRMRVRVNAVDPAYFDLSTLACDENTVYGETEDYTINVGNLGTSNGKLSNFAYYPNPVNDVLNISADQKITSVSVYNVAGQKVINNVKANNGQVNVSRLTSGTYIVTAILENGKTETFKVIKK